MFKHVPRQFAERLEQCGAAAPPSRCAPRALPQDDLEAGAPQYPRLPGSSPQGSPAFHRCPPAHANDMTHGSTRTARLSPVFLFRILSGRRPFFPPLLSCASPPPPPRSSSAAAWRPHRQPQFFLVRLLDATRAQHLRQATLFFPTLHTHNHPAS